MYSTVRGNACSVIRCRRFSATNILSSTVNPNLNPSSSPVLPPLPSFSNDDTRSRVFTHRSLHRRPWGRFEDPSDDPSPDNEALEHLGDSLLNLCVTDLVRTLYPSLRPGPATIIRAKIVSNKNIANIAMQYALGPQLKVDVSQEALLRVTENILADTFEAYIGGLYSDYGLEGCITNIQPWLSTLLTPYAKKAYDEALAEHPAPDSNLPTTAQGYSARLNEKLLQMGKVLIWKEESWSAPPDSNGDGMLLWRIQAIVDGHVVGAGSGLSKKAAKNIAAHRAMEMLAIK